MEGDEGEDAISPVIDKLKKYLTKMSESNCDRKLVDEGK